VKTFRDSLSVGRLVPGINAADGLLTWWLTDVRQQYGDDWADPDAPLFPSERRDPRRSRQNS
jgi:hypothetical protein